MLADLSIIPLLRPRPADRRKRDAATNRRRTRRVETAQHTQVDTNKQQGEGRQERLSRYA